MITQDKNRRGEVVMFILAIKNTMVSTMLAIAKIRPHLVAVGRVGGSSVGIKLFIKGEIK